MGCHRSFLPNKPRGGERNGDGERKSGSAKGGTAEEALDRAKDKAKG